MDTVISLQHLTHLILGVIGSPATYPLGQSGRGSTGFNPQAHFQGMKGTDSSLQRFVEPPP